MDKSVALLASVAAAPRSLAELVEDTTLPRATAHRLALALETHRMLARDTDGRFVLGPRLGELAAAVPDPLVAAATPVLAWLRDESGESAQLYRRDGAQRICVAAAERTHGLRTTVPVGSRLPLSAGSGAQVLTAWEPAATTAPGTHFTERTLVEVRRRGWAQSVGQREAGVASVSAPVYTGRGGTSPVIAAVSVSGPVERLGRSPGGRLATVVVAAAQRISAAVA